MALLMAGTQQTAEEKQDTENPTVVSSNDNDAKPKLDPNYYEQYDAKSVNDAITQYIQNKHKSKYPVPFFDESLLFCEDDDFWHSKAVPNQDDDEYDHALCLCIPFCDRRKRYIYGITRNFSLRIRRSFFVICTPLIFVIIATLKPVPLNIIIGSALLAMFSLYILQVLYYVLSSRASKNMILYRVYSVSDKPSKWANLDTAYVQLIYGEESVQSISELSAIHGVLTKTMLNTLGAYVWCAVTIHFAAELYYNRCVFYWDIVDMFEIIGTGGIVLISIFELDPFSKAMGFGHYMGVMLAAFCPFGYCIQQWFIGEKFLFAVILYVVAFIFLVCFILIGLATDEAQIESKRKWKKDFKLSKFLCLVPGCFRKKYDVTTYSKMNIVFEAAAIYLTTVALCLWLIEYNRSCRYGCAGSTESKEYCEY